MKTILVADDDPNIREVICFALEKAGYATLSCHDGNHAVVTFRTSSPDLVILDIGMPEMDGLDVCRTIRKTDETPILFLSARDEEIDRVLGLEMGGDDYVTKPFSPRELVARVGVILKRVSRDRPVAGTRKVIEHGSLVLDEAQRLVTVEQMPVPLTHIEFNIMRALLGQRGMVFTRDQILNSAYSDNIHVSDRTIDSHIRNIRSKMKQACCESVIDTVHGTGFRLGDCIVRRSV